MAGFPRERRVRRSGEIREIVRRGRSVEGPNLRLHAALAPAAAAEPRRAGVIVPRFGRTAVARNRLRRRLRELVRLHLLEGGDLPGGAFIVRARTGAYGRDFGELRTELIGLRDKLARRAASR